MSQAALLYIFYMQISYTFLIIYVSYDYLFRNEITLQLNFRSKFEAEICCLLCYNTLHITIIEIFKSQVCIPCLWEATDAQLSKTNNAWFWVFSVPQTICLSYLYLC